MFSFTTESKTLVLVMHPMVRSQKRSTHIATNQENMANRDRVKEEPGMFGQREDHK